MVSIVLAQFVSLEEKKVQKERATVCRARVSEIEEAF